MGHPDFRANGRIFATLQADEQTGMVAVTPDEQAELLREHPQVFTPAAGAWGRQGCTLVRLEAATPRIVKPAMLLAWQVVMAKPAPRARKTAARRAQGPAQHSAAAPALIRRRPGIHLHLADRRPTRRGRHRRGRAARVQAAAAVGPRLSARFRRGRANPAPAAPVQDAMTLASYDLRVALRGLRRSPLFSIVAILSLALGIGANTAIYTLIDQMLLRELPVKNPDELVMLYQQGTHNGSNMGMRMHSYPIYQEYQARAEPLSEVIARRLVATSISVDNQTERVDAEMVSGNFFAMLGVGAAVGRVFNSQEDDQIYGGHPVVVLGYDYWDRRFARDPSVVGRKILVNDYPMTIVGVSARGFAGVDPARAPALRVPLLMKAVIVPEWNWFEMSSPRTRWVQVFARLKPGQTVESAQAPLQASVHADSPAREHAREREGLVGVRSRAVSQGPAPRREGRHGLLAAQERLLDAAHRADVHGRPRPADRLRQRREPAHRARVRAPAGDRGPAVARRLAPAARPAAAGREPDAVAGGRRAGAAAGSVDDPRTDRTHSVRRRAAPDSRGAGLAHPGLHLRADARHRHRLRAASGAQVEPPGYVEHAQGHRRRGRRRGRLALPAQGARRRTGRAQLPLALRRRACSSAAWTTSAPRTPAWSSTTW